MRTPEDVVAMIRLYELGWGKRRIARELRCSVNTVRRYLKQQGWQPYKSPERGTALCAHGDFVQAEYFRDGVIPIFGLGALVDGGFGLTQNLPLFARGEIDGENGTAVTTSSGETVIIPDKADFGTLNSGGLY